MISRKHIFTIFSLVGLLNAYTSQLNQSSQAIADVVDCPKQSATLPITSPKKNEGVYDRFDYHIRNIVADANTVKFQTLKYDFVFCRGNKTWTVQPEMPTELQPTQDRSQYYGNLENPPFKTIDFNGKTYQYRVLLAPNISPTRQESEPQKVIFELIAPNSKQPQRQTLYTLNQLKEARVGGSLGVPRITAAIRYDNRLFWAVASEQGEGASGIATIVSYDPQKHASIIIQPPEIKRQQITDLVIAGNAANPTFWMGTQVSGEGVAHAPGMGLVAYRPNSQTLKSGSINYYQVNNSPLVGVIPGKLKLENDKLWIGTGNGVCQLQWQTADNPQSWSCWRFALKANLPPEGLPISKSVLNKTPADTLKPATTGKMVEVLWWMPTNSETRKGRYEVKYPKGFTVTLDEQKAELFPPDLAKIRAEVEPGKPPFYWAGFQWDWNGSRFVRGFDAVVIDTLGISSTGIGSNLVQGQLLNSNAIRGDLDLLSLSRNTSVRYYSGWVDETLLQPHLTVIPQERPATPQPNPLELVARQLKTQ